jgi:NADPH-dependent 2,4-dienoyl-CoA reductase/sulfur reductase-like enzyme
MTAQSPCKTILEPARETRVAREADVVVVGGGPGGLASAVSAARSGARTVLIERYGHLGGMATGGLVNIFPNLSDISGWFNIIPHCIAYGQAAGTAAALAVRAGVQPRGVDYKELQANLRGQGVELPECIG